MRNTKIKEPKSILVGTCRLLPWKDLKEEVFLNFRGQVYSKSIAIPDTRHKDFQRMYFFIKDYLDKKRRRYTVDNIFKYDLNDIREMLWRKNQKSISRNRIEEIVHITNQIAGIKDSIKDRYHKYVEKQWSKELDMQFETKKSETH